MRFPGHCDYLCGVPVGGARPKAISDRLGHPKTVVDQESREILGYHILTPHGDDLLHKAVAAMHDHGTIEHISKSIPVHPTLSESVKGAQGSLRQNAQRRGLNEDDSKTPD